jgi:hypothetical protein
MTVQVERPWEFMAKCLDFGLDLWRRHIIYNRRLQFLYSIDYLYSTHSFGMAIHIPRPLDLDNHSVNGALIRVVHLRDCFNLFFDTLHHFVVLMVLVRADVITARIEHMHSWIASFLWFQFLAYMNSNQYSEKPS